MFASFAGGADDKIKIAGQLHVVGPDKFYRRHHRRETAFLLASAAPPNALAAELIGSAIDDFAGIRIFHRARRRAHGVSNQHQTSFWLAALDDEYQVAHL